MNIVNGASRQNSAVS